MKKSADTELKVELIGDLALVQEPPALSNNILLAPTSPEDNVMVKD